MNTEPTSVSEEVTDQKGISDVSEDRVEEDAEKSTTPSRELKKTWGFRRTTIAKREIPGEMAAETPDAKGAPVRRSGRQAKRTDKLEEFLVTVKRGRGTGRRSCPSRLEGGDPPSLTATDAETASENSFDGNTDAKTEERKVASPVKRKRGRGRARKSAKPKASGGSVSDDCSSENEEEPEGEVTKEEHVETATSAEDGKDVESKEEEQAMDVKKEDEKEEEKEEEEEDNKKENKEENKEENKGENEEENKEENKEKSSDDSINRRPPTRSLGKESKNDTKPKAGAKLHKDTDEEEEEEEDDDESSSSESDSDGYDPNALYCICRQKHNKRYVSLEDVYNISIYNTYVKYYI